jgi:predicted neutral ceramidase superfamily lipid hydrolase
MHSRYAIWCAKFSDFTSYGSGLTAITVDSTIPDYLNAVLVMGISMFAKFVAIVIFSPVFLLPGVAAFVIGALVGQIYIKAQLSVKREMSNARSPVLSHFGAAIAGIGSCLLSPRGRALVDRSL